MNKYILPLVLLVGCFSSEAVEDPGEEDYVIVSVSHSKVTATIYNPSDKSIKCRGNVTGFTTRGNLVRKHFTNILVPPFMDRRLTIFIETEKQIFRSGVGNFSCIKTKDK